MSYITLYIRDASLRRDVRDTPGGRRNEMMAVPYLFSVSIIGLGAAAGG